MHRSIGAGAPALPVVVLFLLFLAVASASWPQSESGREQIIASMVRVVLENNPALRSQGVLVRESERLFVPRSMFAMTGISVTAGTGFLDADTMSFRLAPALTLGGTFSIGDPARALNGYNLRKERESAKQDYYKLKDSIISDLLSNIREVLKLDGQIRSRQKLKTYLQEYSDLIEKQVRAGVNGPEPDRLWDLRERIIDVEAQIEEAKTQLDTTRLEVAMRLGGDAWKELLDLFVQLGAASGD